MVPVDADHALVRLDRERLALTLTLGCCNGCKFLLVLGSTEERQSLDVVLAPGLHSDRANVDRHLRARVHLEEVLHVGLSVAEQRRRRAIDVGQLDGVDADADASLNLRDHLLREVLLAVEAIILR